MSAYARDLLVRIVATALAAVAGFALVELADLTVWWAVPAAAGVTAVRALLASTAAGAALTADVLERTGWTVVQAVVAVLPVHLLDWPAEIMMVVAAALAALKGWLARRVGSPDTAGTVDLRPAD